MSITGNRRLKEDSCLHHSSLAHLPYSSHDTLHSLKECRLLRFIQHIPSLSSYTHPMNETSLHEGLKHRPSVTKSNSPRRAVQRSRPVLLALRYSADFENCTQLEAQTNVLPSLHSLILCPETYLCDFRRQIIHRIQPGNE